MRTLCDREVTMWTWPWLGISDVVKVITDGSQTSWKGRGMPFLPVNKCRNVLCYVSRVSDFASSPLQRVLVAYNLQRLVPFSPDGVGVWCNKQHLLTFGFDLQLLIPCPVCLPGLRRWHLNELKQSSFPLGRKRLPVL